MHFYLLPDFTSLNKSKKCSVLIMLRKCHKKPSLPNSQCRSKLQLSFCCRVGGQSFLIYIIPTQNIKIKGKYMYLALSVYIILPWRQMPCIWECKIWSKLTIPSALGMPSGIFFHFAYTLKSLLTWSFRSKGHHRVANGTVLTV